jgi:hypothetical protein
MSKDRKQALQRLKAELTERQIADLKLVIETAEVQGDYHFNGEDSTYCDDVNATLIQLSAEFSPST